MTNTMWTLAPAGARCPVGLPARAATWLVESPVVVRLRAVPAAPVGTRRPDAFGTRRLGAFDIALTGTPAIDAFGTTGDPQLSKRTNTQHDGTTLGLHSSRRPPPS